MKTINRDDSALIMITITQRQRIRRLVAKLEYYRQYIPAHDSVELKNQLKNLLINFDYEIELAITNRIHEVIGQVLRDQRHSAIAA